MSDLNELSQRELEILKLVATGASNKEIAQELYISANTVKVHLRNIFTKIGVNSRTEAAMYAVANNLVRGAAPDGQVSDEDPDGESEPTAPESRLDGLAAVELEQSSPASRPVGLNVRVLLAALVLLIITGAAAAVFLSRSPAVGNAPEAQAASTLQPRWLNMSEMPAARARMALAVYDNKILAIAGTDEQGASGLMEQYDPLEDQWTELADKPTPVSDVDAAVVGGRIYVPGGVLESGEVTDLVEVYDPVTDAWQQAEPLPLPLSDYALVAFEGSLYLFGGWTGQEYTDVVYRFDPKQDTWIPAGEMPQPRAGAAAAVNGGKIYIAGGRNEEGLLAECAVYLPNRSEQAVSAWEPIAPLPEARADLGLASIADILYAIGGESEAESGTVNSYALFPQDNRWQVFDIASSPFAADAGMISVGRNLYVIGGTRGDELTSENSAYQVLYTISIPVLVK